MALQSTEIAKGHLLGATDKVLEDTTKYRDRLNELQKSGQSLVPLARGQNIVKTSADETHANEEWLGGSSQSQAWWPSAPDKEEILRQGFIAAYEAALAASPVKRIRTLWVHGSSEFFAVVDSGGEQINLFLVTPPPPSGQKVTGTIDENLYVIARQSWIDQILDQYANRADAAKNVQPTSSSGIQKFRVKGA